MRIRTLSEELKEACGQKIYKITLSSGCTCPNRDGTKGTGGCTFCSAGGSGEFAAPLLSIEEQIEIAKRRVRAKIPASIPEKQRRYIAYFQSYTNTYGDISRLKKLYLETIRREEIAALSIGTRPDCLPPEVIRMLSELNAEKPVWVELGLQTIHEKTAERIHRGYALPVFETAYRDLMNAGIKVIVHVILGLPGESREEMLETVRFLSRLTPVLPGIKLQLLHVLRGTELAEEYAEAASRGEVWSGKAPERSGPAEGIPAESALRETAGDWSRGFHILTLEEYVLLVADCLELLPEKTVIHRLTGDGPKKLLLAPLWSADKKRVLNALNLEIRARTR